MAANKLEIECPNLMSMDDKKLWLSSRRQCYFPQTLVLDFTKAQFKPLG